VAAAGKGDSARKIAHLVSERLGLRLSRSNFEPLKLTVAPIASLAIPSSTLGKILSSLSWIGLFASQLSCAKMKLRGHHLGTAMAAASDIRIRAVTPHMS
jgi:hypothetical protein